jgi:hypothetical protein
MRISTRIVIQPTTPSPSDDAARTYDLAEGRSWLDVVLGSAAAGFALLAASTVETWWLWVLAGWVLFVALVTLGSTRRGRAERVVETH